MAFDVDRDMQANIIEILPFVTEKKGVTNLDFDALEKLTSKEFVSDIKKDFEDNKNFSAFTCEVKKITRSHKGENYCDNIYVLIGHSIYSQIYSFPLNSKRGYERKYDLLILNHNHYMELIEPFMKKVDKKLIWKTKNSVRL